MKFTSILASLVLFSTSALSAPTATIRQIQNTTSAQPFSVTSTLYPSLQVLWNSKSTALRSENSARGHLLTNPNEKVNTAVYFAIPETMRGKTCKLVFRLSIDDALVQPGPSTPAVFDLYRLTHCLNVGYSWVNRVERGALAGILTAKKGKWDDKVGAAADWQSVDLSAAVDTTEPAMGAAPTWSCQPGEYSFEMVARPGVNIGWTSGKGSGLSIEMCG